MFCHFKFYLYFSQEQQQYESMMSGTEEIYHDIAPPNFQGSNYANIIPAKPEIDNNAVLSDEVDDSDSQARPLYDDIAVIPKTPEYSNILPDSINFVQGESCQSLSSYVNIQFGFLKIGSSTSGKEEENVLAEHLYDDIGPTEARASVYELIQDPSLNQGIRCS